MSPRKPMVIRTFRVPVALWERAVVVSEERDEAISDVLRAALEQYVKKNSSKSGRTVALND